MYLTAAHSAANIPIIAANNPLATLISAAPPVEVAASAFLVEFAASAPPVNVGADVVAALPPAVAAAVGVNFS